MVRSGEGDTDWDAVIARSLAFLCLHVSDVREAGLVDRANFLMSLGLPRKDCAGLLGSTDESLRVSLGKAARDKPGARSKSARKRSSPAGDSGV